jgi:hypothetical protein
MLSERVRKGEKRRLEAASLCVSVDHSILF